MSRKNTQKKSKPKNSRIISNNVFMIKYLMRHAPLLVIGEFFFHFVSSYPWTLASVWLSKYIIDVVTTGAQLNRIIYAVAIFAVVILCAEFGNNLFFELYVHRKHEELFLKMQSELYARAARIDMEAYDNPEFYNEFVIAMESADTRAQNVLNGMKGLFSTIVSIISVAAIVLSIDPLCFLLIVLSGLIMLPLGTRISKKTIEKREALVPYDRKNMYFMRLFYLPEYAKELRMNSISPLIKQRYDENTVETSKKTLNFTKPLWKLMYCQETLPYGIIVGGIVVLLMGYKVMVHKQATAGDFAATFNGATTIGSTIQWLATWFSVRMRENGLFIEKFRKFLEYEPKITDGASSSVSRVPQTISLENVTFTYPGNSEPSLKNINMEILPGKKVALVGYNGAGKTTLTNLLLRLYDISSGSIKIGGVDIREQTLASHKSRFSAVFQDYKLFAASIGENVAMETDCDTGRALAALEGVGFDAAQKGGLDKNITREFDDNGIELSGGEGQKIAIARAFYKQCPFIILDEPSSNLDPLAEYSLNAAIAATAKDKTVIFISHRLSTTKMADVIFMMENGEIVEEGSHDELMRLNGKYAEMFRIQAEKYTSEQDDAEVLTKA